MKTVVNGEGHLGGGLIDRHVRGHRHGAQIIATKSVNEQGHRTERIAVVTERVNEALGWF